MIANPDVLQADFQPADILHRHDQIDYLSSILEPVREGERVNGAFIYGPTGAGKTCTAQFLLDRLADSSDDVHTYAIDCWTNYTYGGCLRRLLEGFQITTERSTPKDVLAAQLRDQIDEPFVVILDEVDQLEDDRILYQLYEHPQITMVLIANRRDDFYSTLEMRVESRLSGFPGVEFRKYTESELVNILRDRVDAAVQPDAIGEQRLFDIARISGGDARVAISVLRNALKDAEASGAEQVSTAHIEAVIDDARREILRMTISKLTSDQRVLFQVLLEGGELSFGEIFGEYEARVDEPLVRRTIRNHLKKMAHYDIVAYSGEKSGRTYWVVDELEVGSAPA